MGFDQCHEPPHELPAATRTYALPVEEAQAVDCCRQRPAFQSDAAVAHTA
jgi:hypothetical protein